MAKAQKRNWTWHVDRPAEAMWSVLADTARLNEASKLPRHEIEEIPQPDGSVLFLGRAKIGPLALAWREKPVNWVFGQWFERLMAARPVGGVEDIAAEREQHPDE